MTKSLHLAALLALTLAGLATACRIEPDGDADLDGDVEPDGSCCVECTADEITCGDECRPLDDPEHESCRLLEGCACAAGVQCQHGYSLCDDECVSLMYDPDNCMVCGNTCAERWTCNGGCICAEGYELCMGGACCAPDEECDTTMPEARCLPRE